MKTHAIRQELTRELYKKNHWNLYATVFLMVLNAIISISAAFILQQLLDVPSGQAYFTLTELLIILGFALLFLAIVQLALRRTRPAFSRRAMEQYRTRAFSYISQKSMLSFARESSGLYLSALTNDATVIQEQYVLALFDIIFHAILFIGTLVLMLLYSWQMTLAVVLLMMVPLLCALLTGKQLVPLEKKVSDENEGFIGMVKDLLSGFSVIKSFKAEKQAQQVFCEQNTRLENAKCRRSRAQALVELIGEEGYMIAQMGIFFYGIYLALQGEITAGVVLGFVQMMNYIVQPIQQLPVLFSKRKAARGLIDKLAQALEENAQSGGALRPEDLGEGICYENVAFAYSEENGDVLKGVDLHFETGKSYAIVGASGSGKSTLLSLLMGAFDHYRGSITLGGHELRDIDPDCLYDLISIIQQNVFIFNSSIRDNVTMFKEFEEDRIQSALNRAGLKDLMIQRGADFLCGENGASLSGGERQRISIARCLLRETPLMLMDEGTSALDAQTAASVTDAILSIQGLTRLIVTHKIDEKLLRKFDEIVVLAGGRAAERGTFDALMAQKGRLYSLVQIAQNPE